MKPEGPNSLVRREFLKGALRLLALPAISGPWLVGCGGGTSNPVAPTPRLASVDNFRDVAGADNQGAYRTSSGQKLRRGVVYRSNVLNPSPPDMATLDTLNIREVYDLRTPDEITQTPDVPPAGADDRNINLFGTHDNPTPVSNSAAETVALVENGYRTFVTNSVIREALAEVFQALATGGGSQLYHCSEGKDRTGWVTATLHSVLQVPQSVVMENYLLTNTYTAASVQAWYQSMVSTRGKTFADIYLPTQVVRHSYLQAALDQAAASYGSMANYIAYGIGLDVTTQTLLRGKLLT
jgi:protein-tyrosine phosphatase